MTREPFPAGHRLSGMADSPAWRWVAAAILTLCAGCAPAGTSPGQAPTGSAARAWTEPTRYEYTIESSCGERSLFGRIRLTVDNGAVTKAVGVDDSGERAVAALTPANLPTLTDLLDEYEAARRAGAHVARIEYDPVDGHPTLIELDPGAVASPADPRRAGSVLRAHRNRPGGETTRSCSIAANRASGSVRSMPPTSASRRSRYRNVLGCT